MRVLHGTRHLRHQRHCSSRLTAQCRCRIQQTAPTGKLHAEKRNPIVTFAHFIDQAERSDDRGLLQPALHAGNARAFLANQRDKTKFVSAPRSGANAAAAPDNHAHPTATDFLKDLIIPYAPIGVTHLEFTEHIIKRFRLRRGFDGQVAVMPIGAHAC